MFLKYKDQTKKGIVRGIENWVIHRITEQKCTSILIYFYDPKPTYVTDADELSVYNKRISPNPKASGEIFRMTTAFLESNFDTIDNYNMENFSVGL